MSQSRFIAAILALAVLGAAPGTRAEEFTLKVHHFLPPGSHIHADFLQPWCAKLEMESSQRLKCRIFPSMQLGGTPAQLYDQVKDGVVDIVWTVPGYSAGRFPILEVFELPFMMKNEEATSRALWEYVQKYDGAEFVDVKPLALHVHGPGAFHMVRKPISRATDLRGLKVRAPTRQSNRLLSVLGATAVGMPVSQVPESLSKGVIDGALVPFEVVPAIKADELTRYHSVSDPSEAAIYTTVFLLGMNKARYEGLPAELRKVIDANSGIDVSGQLGRIFANGDIAGRKSVPEDSINVIPKAEIDNWKKLAQPVIDNWVKDMNGQNLDGLKLLAAARELIARNSK
jgi:TRAP-type C4-dicarboxylate transport system substrate-binding protein